MRVKSPPLNIDELAKCAAQGVSAQRLAARFGRSVRTIQAIASRNGIRVKGIQQTKSEAARILNSRAS